MSFKPGSTEKTADGVVGTSGKPIRVYSATWISGATAGDLVLRDGTTASGTAYTTAAGTINKSVTVNWEGGLLFPSGCFYDHDSNNSIAVISYIQEQS